MKANDDQCLNLASFSASNYGAVVLTLLDRTLVRRRYFPTILVLICSSEYTEVNRCK